MTIECKCCQGVLKRVSLIVVWTEYRVGGVDSNERFYLCPDCERDPNVDPAGLWADDAQVTKLD